MQIAATTPWLYGAAGGKTTIPAGEIILTDTVTIDNQFGPVLSGAGQFITKFRWQGPPDRPIFAFRNCGYGDFGNFTVSVETPASCFASVCNMPTVGPGVVASSRNRFHDIWIEGRGLLTDGIRINSSEYGGPDQNNELHTIENVRFNGFTGNGVSILSSQSHQNIIRECSFSNSGQVGTAVYARFGSQTMTRCNGSGLKIVFFGGDQYAGVGTITNNDFENCQRFIDLRLPSGVWEVGYNRCDGMVLAPNTDPNSANYDTSAVFSHASGSLNFHDNYFGTPDTVNPMRILFGYCSVAFRNQRNTIVAPKQPHMWVNWASDLTVIPAWNWEGNVWMNPSIAGQPKTTIPHP